LILGGKRGGIICLPLGCQRHVRKVKSAIETSDFGVDFLEASPRERARRLGFYRPGAADPMCRENKNQCIESKLKMRDLKSRPTSKSSVSLHLNRSFLFTRAVWQTCRHHIRQPANHYITENISRC
jgi:hypothetical protein